jgi:para-aminobenzoate synthetase component 1
LFTIDLPYHLYDPAAVAARFVDQVGCVFLDSAAQGRHGRYSFVAADPFLLVTSKGDSVEITWAKDARHLQENPWSVVKSLWERHQMPLVPELPPLQGGLIGFWSYDLGRQIERLPPPCLDDLAIHDLWLGAYDWVVAWDHQLERCWLISTGLPETNASVQAGRAEQRAEQVLAYLEQPVQQVVPAPPARLMEPGIEQVPPLYDLQDWPGVSSTFTPGAYIQAVQRAIEYIYAGDIYQVNLSQRLQAPLRRHPWHIYMALRQHNPADFAAYLDCGDTVIASASPERFLRLDAGVVETRPIKGTIARSPDPDEDRRRAQRLHTSPKDRAENLMIVDLLRNDIGRVCEIGSVEVPELWTLEQHPTVYHLVSTVCGRLRAGVTPLDLLQACFPGGSITGAPKIRAMEIIAELEPTARGVYCGAIGYIGWNGQMDTNIVIRTLVIRQGRVTWQVGGGVVADSTPEGEYAETLAKARALSEIVRRTW